MHAYFEDTKISNKQIILISLYNYNLMDKTNSQRSYLLSENILQFKNFII